MMSRVVAINQQTKEQIMAGSYIDVDAAIKVAKDVLKRKAAIMDEQDIVRSDLRHAVTMGATSPEQAKWIGEQFPLRKRNTKAKGPNDAASAASTAGTTARP